MIKYFILLVSVLLTATTTRANSILINEVDADTPSTDVLEFIELFDGGGGNAALDGLVVVLFNGSDDQSYAAFDLDGYSTDSTGYFVIGNSAVVGVDLVMRDNFLQNGADAVALYQGNATDFPNGTAANIANLLDALVYDTNDADDAGLLMLLTTGGQSNEGGSGSAETYSNQRFPNGSGALRDTSSYYQALPTPGTTNGGLPVPAPTAMVLVGSAMAGLAGISFGREK